MRHRLTKCIRVTIIGYLTRLLGFLRANLRRHQFLRYLINGILKLSDRLDGEAVFRSELGLTHLVLALQDMAQIPHSDSHIWPEQLKNLHAAHYLESKRSNAVLGIALGSYLHVDHINDSLKAIRETWEPLEHTNPSSLEKVAMACHFTSNLNIDFITIDTTLEIKTQIGFVLVKRKLFSLAKGILDTVLLGIETRYGASSLEYGIAVADFVKCCNMTQEEAAGERKARYALSRRSTTDDRAETRYLKIALADSLLASSNYVAAVEVLDDVLADENAEPLITIKAAIRLSKAERRLGKDFPSARITAKMTHGLQLLDHAPDTLRSAFIEEVVCNVARFDTANVLSYQQALALFEVVQSTSQSSGRHLLDKGQLCEAKLLEARSQMIENFQRLQQNLPDHQLGNTIDPPIDDLTFHKLLGEGEMDIPGTARVKLQRLPTDEDFQQLGASFPRRIRPPKGEQPLRNIIIVLHDNIGDASIDEALEEIYLVQIGIPLLLSYVQFPHKSEDRFTWASCDLKSQFVLEEVIKKVLVAKCNFDLCNIAIIGYGKAGSIALNIGLLESGKLGGIISFGGLQPDEVHRIPESPKLTPVLLFEAKSDIITQQAEVKIKKLFVHVDVARWRDFSDELWDVSIILNHPKCNKIVREFLAHSLGEEECTKPEADLLGRDHGTPRSLLNRSRHIRRSYHSVPFTSSLETLPEHNPLQEDFEALTERQDGMPSYRREDRPRIPTAEELRALPVVANIIPPKARERVENIIIALHDHSGNEFLLQEFAELRLRPKDTTCLLLRGVSAVAGKENSYQWKDNLNTFFTTSQLILGEVISALLISKCNFAARRIIVFGQGEGAMAALATLLTWERVELGGVICVGGQLPSYATLSGDIKSKTAVLLLGGALGMTTPAAKNRIEQNFSYVDCDLLEGKDDVLPRGHQLISLQDFFEHRLHHEEWTKPAIITFGEAGSRLSKRSVLTSIRWRRH
jgi:predicted esterase